MDAIHLKKLKRLIASGELARWGDVQLKSTPIDSSLLEVLNRRKIELGIANSRPFSLDLSGVNLFRAYLNGANLYRVILSSADLKGAKLSLAIFKFSQKEQLEELGVDTSIVRFID